jgi:hypothetical protein
MASVVQALVVGECISSGTPAENLSIVRTRIGVGEAFDDDVDDDDSENTACLVGNVMATTFPFLSTPTSLSPLDEKTILLDVSA